MDKVWIKAEVFNIFKKVGEELCLFFYILKFCQQSVKMFFTNDFMGLIGIFTLFHRPTNNTI